MKLIEAISILKDAGIENARGEARELFAHYGAPRAMLVDTGYELDSPDISEAICKRAEGEPLQYIIGEVGFFREIYRVTPEVLIPRADTELLVEYAVGRLKKGDRILDLCTGSGCVAISTLANSDSTTALAVDISEGALTIAKENAERNGVLDRLTLQRRDLLTEDIGREGKFDAILSNPPYIPTEVYKGLSPEIFKEPRIAFDGGEDGSIFYRRLIPLALERLAEGGFIAMEIGLDQGELLARLAGENGCRCEILRDIESRDRVAVLTPKN